MNSTLHRRQIVRTWGACVLVLGLGLNALWLCGNALTRTPVVGVRDGRYTPYTLVTARSFRTASGSIVRSNIRATFAVRSDGAYVDKYEALDNRHYWKNTIRRTISFPSGLLINTDDVAELKSTMLDKVGNRIRLASPQEQCLRTRERVPLREYRQSAVSEEVVSGYRTVVVRGANSTLWYAVDVGCALLQADTDFGPNGLSRTTLESLTPGEPSPDLFAVRDAYEEVPPSVRIRSQATPREDEQYYSRRPPLMPATSRR